MYSMVSKARHKKNTAGKKRIQSGESNHTLQSREKTATENYTRLPVKLNLSNKKLLDPVQNDVDMQCKQQNPTISYRNNLASLDVTFCAVKNLEMVKSCN